MASQEFHTIVSIIKQLPGITDLLGDELDLQKIRDGLNRSVMRVPKTVKVRGVTAAGLQCEWIYDETSHPDRRLLYLHGGGYIAGGLVSHRPLAAWIARAAGCSVLHVNYRLAPEHPFPAAVEDAASAFTWLLENGPDGQGRAAHSFIAGDSAGGGLTLASMMMLRENGNDLPDAAATISAYTDLAFTGETIMTRADADLLVPMNRMETIASAYLGNADPKTPLASPLYGDPAGLPPMLMQVGDAEVLLDSTTRFAEKAKKAGVDVTLEVWPEMFHVWHICAPLFPEAEEGIERIGKYIQSFC